MPPVATQPIGAIALWRLRLARAAATARDAVRARREPARTYPRRIGLICLVDLVQDAELIVPVARAAAASGSFDVRIVMTDWLDRVAPFVRQRIEAAGFAPMLYSRDAIFRGAAPPLKRWDALLTASETTTLAHRVGHALTRRANAAGLLTFTMQHGLENLGLTYRDDGEHDFASQWIFTWGDPKNLPDWAPASVRARCIGTGRAAESGGDAGIAVLAEEQRPIVAVFENLHWARYDDTYRHRFIEDLKATASARPDLLFVLKPHPAGLYARDLTALAARPDNLLVADFAAPEWRDVRAADLIARARNVITTPSTIALDAARAGRPVAVAAYDLALPAYAGLSLLARTEDWAAFVAAAEVSSGQDAFLDRHELRGDAVAAIVESMLTRATPRAAQQAQARHALLAALPQPLKDTLQRLRGGDPNPGRAEYQRWIDANDTLNVADRAAIAAICATWGPDAVATVIIDARYASDEAVARTRASVEQQLARTDVVVCKTELGEALNAAQTTHVAVVAAGDTIAPHAIFTLTTLLHDKPDALFAYSDEDVIDAHGRREAPYFKPDWSPDLFRAQDYACRLALFSRTDALASGGFNGGRGVHDPLRRMTESAPTRPVLHAPFVLYHAADRRTASITRARTSAPTPSPLVSLIVPTRDNVGLLRNCLSGLLHRTDYANLEIIIVDNDSREAETRAYFAELKAEPRVRIIEDRGAFNFARLNNVAAREAKGEILGLVNNDISVIEPGWLSEMVTLAARADVGAVGAMLLYPNGRIQHAGCTLGIGAVAAHLYAGAPADAPGHGGRLRFVQDLSAVTAACMLTRRTVWDAASGMEEDLHVAYNDIDYCLRLRRDGLRVLWTPFARLEHQESVSRGSDKTGDQRARLEQDKAFMRGRWGAALTDDPFYSPNLTLTTTRGGLAAVSRARKPWA